MCQWLNLQKRKLHSSEAVKITRKDLCQNQQAQVLILKFLQSAQYKFKISLHGRLREFTLCIPGKQCTSNTDFTNTNA